MNIEMKNEKKLPTPEVVARKLELLQQIDALTEKNDFGAANQLIEESEQLNKIYSFHDQIFEENGKKGLKDFTGKVRVPARYAGFSETYHYECLRHTPVVAIDEHDKCALVATDGIGDPLTPFIYDDIHHPLIFPYFMTLQGDKKGFITPKGEVIVPCELDTWSEPFNGITIVQAGDKFGVFTDFGLYVAPVYDETDIKDDNVYVRKGNQWGFLDFEGNFIDENDEDTLDATAVLSYTPDF